MFSACAQCKIAIPFGFSDVCHTLTLGLPMEGPVQVVPFPQPVILCLIWACLSLLLCSCTGGLFVTKVNRNYFLCDVVFQFHRSPLPWKEEQAL